MKARFAPSPTGSFHVGEALAAVVNRSAGGTMPLRIDDTDAARDLPGGGAAILADLAWLGVGWDEGPVRRSERQERYRAAAAGLARRFNGVTLLRDDGTATSQLASVVDDVDIAITHVIHGVDHRAKAIVRELKAAGGHLRAVRLAPTGRESRPELWAVLAALPRDESLRRVDAAL
jgi:glutamyl/glutaminyl-tRNA synthetase